MRLERGFGGIEIGVAIAAAVVVAMLGGGLWIQTKRVEACAVQRQALEKANVELKESLEKQNAAVDSLLKATEDRQKQAKVALEAARLTAAASRAEAGRLKALQASSGTCEEAVLEVRKGLKP